MRGVLFYNSSNGEGATAQLQSLHDHGPTERDGSVERKEMMRHLAVPVAMAIFAGTMIGSAGPAQANKIQYAGVAYGQLEPSDELVAPGLPDYPTMYVQVDFITSESGASVRATNVQLPQRN